MKKMTRSLFKIPVQLIVFFFSLSLSLWNNLCFMMGIGHIYIYKLNYQKVREKSAVFDQCHMPFFLLVTRSGDILRIDQISQLISSTSLSFIVFSKTTTTTLSITSLCYRKIRQSLYVHTAVVQLNAKNSFPCHADRDRCLTFFSLCQSE